ncbi:MAG: methyl-accepting chemotaxis protein [Alphaproteobacteria bacterium]|nr:methyl-accepting chemotaxis protein [Alphaproteobacteria bacterium]
MVSQMPINVMMCDKDSLEINYVNQTSITTLSALESLLPCKAANLLGQNIDIFHKNPSHQRALLADPSNLPHHARIKLGPETLNLQVSAINDASGNYIGPMLSWSVVTKQVGVADDFEQNVKGVVETVSSAATEMQASSEAMAATAEKTASQASTVASAAEELSSSIQEISRQLASATAITTEGVQQAKRSNELVMGLSEAAEKVGEIVNLINDIAAQTNLLALNATIEAARAGDAGKGFAVVASEVKNLATQTAKATDEISSQINGIQNATGDAVKALQTIGTTIEQINEISTTIASAVTEQGAATEEVTRNVSGVHQSSSESGKAASEVLGGAGELAQQSEFLRGQVDEFLVEVRAM